jgi:hypothetical protein
MSTFDLQQLREKIVATFSLDEMATLCSDLCLEYEEIPGQTRSAKARELISYCQRRGRLLELVQYCQTARPNVPWH